MSCPPSMLLVGHGTRDQQGLRESFELQRKVQARFEGQVELGFIELAQPTLSQALAKLIDGGHRQVILVPMLLFAAGHAKQDLPAFMAEARARYPQVTLRQAKPLDCHPSVVELTIQRQTEVLAKEGAAATGIHILVTRGSSDPDTPRQLGIYLEACRRAQPGWDRKTAYLAMAKPTLADVSRETGQHSEQTVVVQPHLLFCGRMLAQLTQEVEQAAARNVRQKWLQARHLGPDEAIAQALLDRYQEASLSARDSTSDRAGARRNEDIDLASSSNSA